MSERKRTGEPGDVVELADKEGGFTDPQTGFDISRDQKVELGDSVGDRTQQAILSGGLLIVEGKAAKAEAKRTAEAEKTAAAEAAASATGNEPAPAAATPPRTKRK